MKACFASEMRGVDKAASEIGRIPEYCAYGNAAMACVEELKTTLQTFRKIGRGILRKRHYLDSDGFAILRHLYNLGIDVAVYLVCGNEFKGDAKS